MDNYTTILGDGRFEYEDKKSVFLGFARPVSTENDALAFIAAVKKAYPDARHHVYAYSLRENSIARFSDDHEPQGTAGMPVLDAIRKNGCVDVVIVVVRYFGGVLLGTGGLVRAYSSAAVGAIKAGEIVTYSPYTTVEIKASYSDYQKILPLLSKLSVRVNDTKFFDNVVVYASIKSDDSQHLNDKLNEIASGRIELKITGESMEY